MNSNKIKQISYQVPLLNLQLLATTELEGMVLIPQDVKEWIRQISNSKTLQITISTKQ